MDVLEQIVYPFTLDVFKNGRQRIVEGYEVGETCMRVMEISLKAGTKTFELPLGNVSAVMYVKRPSDTNPSINACIVDGENNRIIYEIQESDIEEAGLVEMQLKIFDNENIIISPSFALDVWGSIVDDSQASQSAAFTALTAALAEAQAYSQATIVSVTIDQDTLIFKATAADGTTYTSNALAVAVAAVNAYKLVAEGYAVGTQEGTPVASDSPYYQNNAKYYKGLAYGYSNAAENAKGYAYQYANDAHGYANDAGGYKDQAYGYVGDAHDQVVLAQAEVVNAHAEAVLAESYAVGGTNTRTGEDNDNSKYYKERCEQIAASLEGGFVPMGTVLFANLPTENIKSGWMYNVSDSFTSDSRFEDGGGIEYPAGTNVYYTAQSKWDCLSAPYQTAGNTAYDNTESGLVAENVQDAIDELASDKISKSETSGLVKNDGTIDTTTYVSDISGKADKVDSATNGNFAGLDASGNLTDSGKKASDFATDDEMSAIVNVYGSKNFCHPDYNPDYIPYSNNGINAIKNKDGSIFIAQGTATANVTLYLYSFANNSLIIPNGSYKFSGCPERGELNYTITLDYKAKNTGTITTIGIDTGEGVEFTLDGDYYSDDNVHVRVYITIPNGTVIPSGGLTFRPMVRDARISDDTYVPYAPTNRELMSYKANGRVGAHNLLSYPYYDTTKTDNGTIYTDIGDGTIQVSGSPSAQSNFTIHYRLSTGIVAKLPKGSYKLTGCPLGGGISTYYITLSATVNGNFVALGEDYGDGLDFTVTDEATLTCRIYVESGANLSTPIIFKPMFRIAEDTDNTWQPYAMTNKELTEARVKRKTVTATLNASGTIYLDSYVSDKYKVINAVAYSASNDDTTIVSKLEFYRSSLGAIYLILKCVNDIGTAMANWNVNINIFYYD